MAERGVLQHAEGILIQYDAVGVVGRGEEDGACPFCQHGVQAFGCDLKAVLLRAERNIDARPAISICGLYSPNAGTGNNDLVAGVENRHQSAHQCLRGADGYESFLRRVSTSETGVDVRGDFTAKFGIACVGRIMRFAAEYGFGDALAHGNRRVEIRFADGQRDTVGNPAAS